MYKTICIKLFVCLYVRSYLMKPLADLPQNLTEELGRTMGMFLIWFRDSKLSRSTVMGENS